MKKVTAPYVYGRVNGFPARIRNNLIPPMIERSPRSRFAPDWLLDAIFAIEEDAPSSPDAFLAHAITKGFTPDASAKGEYFPR